MIRQDAPLIRTALAVAIGAAISLGILAECTSEPTADAASVVAPTQHASDAVKLLDIRTVPVDDAVAAVKSAADAERVAAEREADAKRGAAKREAATPKYTCDTDAPAKLVGNIIVNRDCPSITAEKERANREYAQQSEITEDQTNRMPGVGAMAPREKTSGELQFEYGCQQGYITEGC